MKHPGAMDSPEFSMLSSLRGEFKPEDYIQPHYKESYRQAIDCLVKEGRDSYREFLKGERIGSFLSEDELLFITSNAETPPPQTHTEDTDGPSDNQSSSGTYWPLHSDVETPDLDLGWPDFPHDNLQTNIDLLFHPPRQNSPTIKEVIRKHIQDARQVVAIVMDTFTDIDIFKEVIEASVRGVPVYVLLDHFHLIHFLTMAENQDVKIPQLRNMRVRTVKGQDYLCRSGAKFHGGMEQKFLLVDCHTAIYGSYSFTWSFEKINLSMVQVIKGHLVKLYDEEFRTLYARSIVPAELCLPEGLFPRNGPHGRQVLPKLHSGQKMERKDMLRHTLDNVFRKTCDRKLGMRDFEEKLLEEGPNEIRPLVENGIKAKGEVYQLQCSEMMNLQKRHSYAGERQDSYVPQNIRPRASHWNISRETGTGPNNLNMDGYLQVPHAYRGQTMCQSYNDSDKPILSFQQNVPTLENTSKSFMRSWRIESYLKNPDVPFRESTDYLDQFEQMDKAGSFVQGRTRSSFVFRSNIPEQMEPNRHMNNSAANVVSQTATHTPLHYTSTQWNATAAGDGRANEEFMLKRQSLQILDDTHYDAYLTPGRNSYQTSYASLGRNKGGHMMTNPDLLTDGWQKRHSLADPRSNTEYAPELPGPIYGAFARMQINRSMAGFNAHNDGHLLNLNEDQRSHSHFDVKNMTNKNWQEPPSRTLSAAALEGYNKDLTGKPISSPNYSKKLSTRINSLLNIPENKEDSFGTPGTPSLKSTGSTATITAEDEQKMSVAVEKPQPNRTYLVRSASEHQDHRRKIEQNSNSHLTSDEPRHTRQLSLPKTPRYKKPSLLDKSPKPIFDTGSLKRNKSAETRLYSRFEGTLHNNTHAQDKHFTKTDTTAEPHFGRTSRGHHENKLEKFFQRVGNFIHKNK